MYLAALVITHPLLLTPAAYVADAFTWALPDEHGTPVEFLPWPMSTEAGDSNASGQDTRGIGISDPQLVIWSLLLDNIGGDTPVIVRQYLYDTDDTSAPISVAEFEIDDADIDLSRALSLSVASASVDYAAPRDIWNRRNTPQLRR